MARPAPAEGLSATYLVVAVLAAALGMLAYLTGFSRISVVAVMLALTEGGMALLIVIAGAGYAYPLVRHLGGEASSLGLRLATSAALGLWMIWTAILLVGSLTTGLLKAYLWWPVVAAGVLLAAWQGRERMESLRLGRWFDGRALAWVPIALAGAACLAGATQPPGYIDLWGDSYDVLEYHLQLPREYFLQQHIQPLEHNVYSHYPLGVEMLFLLGMVLRGGPYQGMYLANILHGAFAALAVAGVFAGLRRSDDTRARIAAVLLATAPLGVYLSWLAMVELAQVCYLALALVWLGQWLQDRRGGAAGVIGCLLGAACATKYLAIGFVAGPVLAVMLAWCLRRPRLLGQWALAAALTGLLVSPWLIRNAVSVGNPVFPLATRVLGRGHFTPRHEQRWLAGHAPSAEPPVPPPPGYDRPRRTVDRVILFYRNFLRQDLVGLLPLMLAGVALAAYLAGPAGAGGWNWSIVAVLAMQLGVWTAATHEMPSRFLAPVLVPLALMGADTLGRLSRLRRNPFRAQTAEGGTPWGRPATLAVLAATVMVNVITIAGAHAAAIKDPSGNPRHFNGVDGEMVAEWITPRECLEQCCHLMLVGDSAPFYKPPGTIYATVFDAHPLVEIARQGLSPAQTMARLRELGVTHIWVDWLEILRLATTYGFDEPMGPEVVLRRRQGRPPGLRVLDQLAPYGLELVHEVSQGVAMTQTAPSTQAAQTAPAGDQAAWPIASIYALPWALREAPASQPGRQ
jgi:hypothetical protein